jgi:hypothetical protein
VIQIASFSVDHLGGNRVKAVTLLSLKTGRAMFHQDTGCLLATAPHEHTEPPLPLRLPLLLPLPCSGPCGHCGCRGRGNGSESGNIKIDSTVGTGGDELFVLVYFSRKFLSATDDDVALLLPELLLTAVE